MMKKRYTQDCVLYICSTYYHILIVLLKRFYGGDTFDIMITNHVPNGEEFIIKLKKTNLFRNVFYQPFVGDVAWDKCVRRSNSLFFHLKNACIISKQMVVNLNQYKELYLFHDDTWIARYLKDAFIKYNLIEDSMNSFKHLQCSRFSYMLMKGCPKWKIFLKNFFHIGYCYLEKSWAVKTIEVNDNNDLLFNSSKIVTQERRSLFEKLTEKQKEEIVSLFECKLPVLQSDVILFLTQPLFRDHYVTSESDEIIVAKIILSRYVEKGKQIVIKPHPRDTVDYALSFPDAIILDRFIPIEVYSFVKGAKFLKIISLFSSSTLSNEFTEERINIFNDETSWKEQVQNLIACNNGYKKG